MGDDISKPAKPEDRRGRNWVQTERSAHEAWGNLIGKAPIAAQLMHVLVAYMGDGNAVVASQTTLGELLGRTTGQKPKHRNTVRRAINQLKNDHWIEVVQIGGKGGSLAYVINSRVAWRGPREQLRYARFSAQVIASETEQDDIDELPPLRKVPTIMHGEEILPTGPGEPPPSQQQIEGMEPYIERADESERAELERRGQQRIPYAQDPE